MKRRRCSWRLHGRFDSGFGRLSFALGLRRSSLEASSALLPPIDEGLSMWNPGKN
jgi:hypothetical protein